MSPIRCRVEPLDLHRHLYRVVLTVPEPAAEQTVSLPVWIPGSYLVREFARNLQALQALQAGRRIAVRQLDKCSWQVRSRTGLPLELHYQVVAFDASVRSAWLDSQRGFFNGTSLLLRVHGQEADPHQLDLAPGGAPADWQVATSLSPLHIDERGFGSYLASDYDELVDSPFELGAFWIGRFKAGGIPHRFVVAGAPPGFDGQRLLDDTRAICEEQIRFWHPAAGPGRARQTMPFRSYLFLLNAVDEGYGGLEHRQSTALICARRDLPRHSLSRTMPDKPNQSEGYTTLLGLISHEYFHTWNVKRLRPAEFGRYDYSRENHSELLWFFEGFTSYYDDLLLRRAGLLDDAGYLKQLAKTLNQVVQTPGRRVQSVAQASFDAWTRYYRPDENTPNNTVSYYTKGALVALCLDLTLRAERRTTLDTVMRGLWRRCAGGPMTESDLLAELSRLGGRSYARELGRWVHGTDELPVPQLLEGIGVLAATDPAPLAQQLGIRVTEGAGITIKNVLRGGAAEQAGMAPGDEWIAVGDPATGERWRLTRLDDLPLYLGLQRHTTAWVARDRRILELPLRLPSDQRVWRPSVREPGLAAGWLGAQPVHDDQARACGPGSV
ncbi:MAG: M61 family metallopeptidase [Rhodoferax sp.]|nr:M61 family metallopeptidase [Rhodoferax sp.]